MLEKAGEFYTPHEVSVLMSEIVAEHLKDRKQIKIYDPTSGSGSLLINIGRSVAKYISGDGKIDYYAQELKENTFNLTRMNLVMRGIKPANINVRNGDTLEDDWPFFEENKKETTYKLVRWMPWSAIRLIPRSGIRRTKSSIQGIRISALRQRPRLILHSCSMISIILKMTVS